MEFAIPTGAFGVIAESVVMLSIGGADCHGTRNVVAVIKSEASGFRREVLHGLMRSDCCVMGIGNLLCGSLLIVQGLDGADKRVGGEAQGLIVHAAADEEASRVNGIDGDSRGSQQ